MGLQAGERIGERYTLELRLGAGGMGEVWLVELHGAGQFRRRVVLKVLAPERRGDVRLASMLADEARLVALLHHPGIVAAIDYLETEEHGPIFVLEFVDGASLRTILQIARKKDVQLPEELAGHIGAEVALSLHAAHTSQPSIIHRDVAPDNVLISRLGRVYLGDFGVARAEGYFEQTTPGTGPKGKRAYMAPEQALGQQVGPPADVYALGLVLRECVPNPSPALQAVLAKCTAHEVNDRYATAADVAHALHEAVPAPLDHDTALATWMAENASEALVGRMTSAGARKTPPPAGKALEADSRLFASVPPPTRRALKFAATVAVLLIFATPLALIARANGGVKFLSAAIAGTPDPQHGELKVTSRPISAEVYVDGTLRGNTPASIELTTGKHQIRVASPRMEKMRAAEIVIKDGVQHELNVDLSE
jgi:hypothetical protein